MIKAILIIGFLFNFAAFGSFYSTLVFILTFYFSKLITRFLFKKEQKIDNQLSIWIFSLGYFFVGITELLIVNFGYEWRIVGPDAWWFFRYASDPDWSFNNFISESIRPGYISESVIGLKEDFIPILIWNKIYNFLNFLNIPSGRYIGTAINTLFLTLTSHIGLSILRQIKTINNKKTEKFYLFLFCSNGILWMYGSIHLREAFVMFALSVLLKVWINWINKKSFANLISLGIISIIFYLSAEFLRGGYSYIIFLFIFSYLLINIFQNIFERKILLIQIISYLSIILVILINFTSLEKVLQSSSEVFDVYNSVSSNEASGDSLGIILINLPAPLRIFSSAFYLLFMPIPIWSGQEYGVSMYHFFKSWFAIFNYFTFPMLIIIIKDTVFSYRKIDKLKLFLIFLLVQSLFIIGMTSLDSRHFGNFSLIYLILICYFDWNNKVKISEYKSLITYLFLILFVLYFLYMYIKFQSTLISLIFISIPLIILSFMFKEKLKIR